LGVKRREGRPFWGEVFVLKKKTSSGQQGGDRRAEPGGEKDTGAEEMNEDSAGWEKTTSTGRW